MPSEARKIGHETGQTLKNRLPRAPFGHFVPRLKESNEYPGPTGRGKWLAAGECCMARCKFCGLEVQWVEQRGVRVPVDPSFGDHRASCAGIFRDTRRKISDNDHERRVAQFLAKKERR
jgi:hypothetical protein